MIVYGANPVRELVLARSKEVHVVYLAAGDSGPALRELARLCADRAVLVENRDRDELDRLAGAEGARHQGAVALTGEAKSPELEEVLDDLEGKAPLLVVLDGVQDPRNLGAIIRSAHVLGAHAVVIPKDRAAPVTPVTIKAAAGATEHLPVVTVTNLVRAIETMKARGIWTVAAVAEHAPEPAQIDLRGPIALVMGAEGKGVRPLVLRHCDHKACIPMVGRVASLNVSVAAGILLYEAARQRGGE